MPSQAIRSLGAQSISHGQHIFVYANIRTNQTIYSLTRSMNNNQSLKQLPYLGKKTVPSALRKDLWQPLCLVSFPLTLQGLAAFRKLREYKRLHETSYDKSIITNNEEGSPHKGQLYGTKKRGKILMNQKANSIADIAAVLLQQERPPTEEELARADAKLRPPGKIGKPNKPHYGLQRQDQAEAKVMGTVEGVTIQWADILDAEYAETWPKDVVHGGLAKSRYTAAFPRVGDDWTEEERRVQEEVEREVMEERAREREEMEDGGSEVDGKQSNDASSGGISGMSWWKSGRRLLGGGATAPTG
ncbi:hypothetical protein MMC09_004184 [Bachmanniomyces sp. S44760]|nr:hypothetical protein [Bachmanniomyces sp. S44760]